MSQSSSKNSEDKYKIKVIDTHGKDKPRKYASEIMNFMNNDSLDTEKAITLDKNKQKAVLNPLIINEEDWTNVNIFFNKD